MRKQGRPSRSGEMNEIDLERGRRIAAWIRSGMKPPHSVIEMTNADVAKATTLAPSTLTYLLNDGLVPDSGELKLATEETLLKIADGLRLSLEDGRKARNWTRPRRDKPADLSQADDEGVLETGQFYRLWSRHGRRIRFNERLLRILDEEAELQEKGIDEE